MVFFSWEIRPLHPKYDVKTIKTAIVLGVKSFGCGHNVIEEICTSFHWYRTLPKLKVRIKGNIEDRY